MIRVRPYLLGLLLMATPAVLLRNSARSLGASPLRWLRRYIFSPHGGIRSDQLVDVGTIPTGASSSNAGFFARQVIRLILAALLVGTCGASNGWAEQGESGDKFFEDRIRPLLIKHCYECHGTTLPRVS